MATGHGERAADSDDPRIIRSDRRRRALAFDATIRSLVVSQRQRLAFGTALLTPELPLIYDLSTIVIERPVAAAELLPVVEQAFAAAGLRHRKITTERAEVAAALVPVLGEHGFELQRHVIMAHDREWTPSMSPLGITEATPGAWAPTVRALVFQEPWGDEAVAEQMVAMHERLRERAGATFLTTPGGEGSCHLYRRGPTAQIEDVNVLAEHRGQGIGRAVMVAALQRCQDASLVFLTADADDWPKDWYARMGFAPVAAAWQWMKRPPRDQ